MVDTYTGNKPDKQHTEKRGILELKWPPHKTQSGLS